MLLPWPPIVSGLLRNRRVLPGRARTWFFSWSPVQSAYSTESLLPPRELRNIWSPGHGKGTHLFPLPCNLHLVSCARPQLIPRMDTYSTITRAQGRPIRLGATGLAPKAKPKQARGWPRRARPAVELPTRVSGGGAWVARKSGAGAERGVMPPTEPATLTAGQCHARSAHPRPLVRHRAILPQPDTMRRFDMVAHPRFGQSRRRAVPAPVARRRVLGRLRRLRAGSCKVEWAKNKQCARHAADAAFQR